ASPSSFKRATVSYGFCPATRPTSRRLSKPLPNSSRPCAAPALVRSSCSTTPLARRCRRSRPRMPLASFSPVATRPLPVVLLLYEHRSNVATDTVNGFGGGGGIYSLGTLTVTASTLSGNQARYGGGIDNHG